MKAKRIPDSGQLQEYNYAVAGHAGTLSDVDGIYFIKPCTQAEIDFYNSSRGKPLASIMPDYHGTLTLTNPSKVDTNDTVTGFISDAGVLQPAKEQIKTIIAEQVSDAPTSATMPNNNDWSPSNGNKIRTSQAAVLVNATRGFTKPNILDVKLGKRLHADDAPAAKKARFTKIAEETTHKNLGFRIAGMRVYLGLDNGTPLDAEGYRVYDKDYGRFTMNDENIADGFRRFVENEAAGIQKDLAQAVYESFVKELEYIQTVLNAEETEMYSSSLLFVFEGDGKALLDAIDHHNEKVRAYEARQAKKADRTTPRTDSGIDLDDGEELNYAHFSGNGHDEDYDDEDEGIDPDDERPQPCSVKLIDFAHAKFNPGKGRDENLLHGVKSVLDIFKRLAKE